MGLTADVVAQSRHVLLRPIAPTDLDFLYTLTFDDQVGYVWRYRGLVPSPDRFRSDFWSTDIVTQYLVVDRSSGSNVGLVSAYGTPTGAGLKLAAMGASRFVGQGHMAEAFLSLAVMCFVSFPIHKVYVEMLDDATAHLGSIARQTLCLEGTLRGHDPFAGGRRDLQIFALYPDRLAVLINRFSSSLGIELPHLNRWLRNVLGESSLAADPLPKGAAFNVSSS